MRTGRFAKAHLALAAVVAALSGAGVLSACASTALPADKDRIALTRELTGRSAFLKSSVHVFPFFTDAARRLVSVHPPDSLELLDDASGHPVSPGEPLGTIPLGTRVWIDKIEFPTSLVVARRPLYSPRTVPWIFLSVVGEPSPRPYVAVLRQGIRTRDEFRSAFDALFTEDDPSPWLQRYPLEVRRAISEKRALAGMDSEAVALSWGRPEKIRQDYDNGAKVEKWTWPLGKRTATFRDGKLAAAEPALELVVP